MGRTTTRLSIHAIALGLVLGCTVGCYIQDPGHQPVRRIDAEAAGRAAIAEYDTNGDGKISGAELDRCPGVKAAINQIDRSGNGAVTSETIAARIHAWRDSKLGAMTVTCRVTHDGRPIPDAAVKFVPERFLGENVRTETGKTDAKGIAIIHPKEAAKPSYCLGLAPGFYRVEITKHGVNIPAKYNAKTILGLEIALDAKWITKRDGKPLEFDLEY
jgi:hypothetical protein